MEGAIEAANRRVLEAFDVPGGEPAGGEVLTVAEMADVVSGPDGLAEMRAAAEELVARGWLRRAPEADAYARTEDGRLAVAGALDVTLYTRPGCHLCDEMKEVVRRVTASAQPPVEIEEIDISTDPDLEARYGLEIPVLLVNGRKAAKFRVTEPELLRILEGRQ